MVLFLFCFLTKWTHPRYPLAHTNFTYTTLVRSPCEPGIWILKSKAREHEQYETTQKEPMLNALSTREPYDGAAFESSFFRSFFSPHERVMRNHTANNQDQKSTRLNSSH